MNDCTPVDAVPITFGRMPVADDGDVPLPDSPGGSVLVVDDDTRSRELFCDLLEARGYSVRFADNGQQALEEAFV